MQSIIQSRLEEMKARSLSGELSESDREFINQYYERITFRTLRKRNCGRCYNDAFIEMYTIFKKKGLRKMGKARLKNGVVLQSAKFEEVITNDNLTDEIAVIWLEDNPTRVDLFSSLPDGFEDPNPGDGIIDPGASDGGDIDEDVATTIKGKKPQKP